MNITGRMAIHQRPKHELEPYLLSLRAVPDVIFDIIYVAGILQSRERWDVELHDLIRGNDAAADSIDLGAGRSLPTGGCRCFLLTRWIWQDRGARFEFQPVWQREWVIRCGYSILAIRDNCEPQSEDRCHPHHDSIFRQLPGAGGGGRTHMTSEGRGILSPVRLPVPPLQPGRLRFSV